MRVLNIEYWQRQQSDGTKCSFFKTRIPPSVFEGFNLHPKHVNGPVTREANCCDISPLKAKVSTEHEKNIHRRLSDLGLFMTDITDLGESSSSFRSMASDLGNHI